MGLKAEVGTLLAVFLCCTVATWYGLRFQYERVNTPEVLTQNKVNRAIRADLCERVERDLDNFKDIPNTFRRTSLNLLEAESRKTLRHLLVAEGVPKDFPIDYRSSEPQFSECQKSLERWLALPTVEGLDTDEGRRVAGQNKPEKANDHSGQANNSEVSALRGTRLALVIGNGRYLNRPLRNPENDANDVSAELKELGFEVIDVRNADSLQLKKALDEYLRRLRTSDVGVIYFSGHGVEYAGRNYLLPTDFQANDEDEIPRQATDLTILVDKVSKAQGKLNIIIVDACRSNFVSASRRSASQGLAKMPPVEGTIVAFSTAPGQVASDGDGRNSPYTKNLIRVLAKPGLKVEDVFKETAKLVEIETAGRQQPWYTSNVTSQYALR